MERLIFRAGSEGKSIEMQPIDDTNMTVTIRIGGMAMQMPLTWYDAQALVSGVDFWLTSGISPFMRGPAPEQVDNGG